MIDQIQGGLRAKHDKNLTTVEDRQAYLFGSITGNVLLLYSFLTPFIYDVPRPLEAMLGASVLMVVIIVLNRLAWLAQPSLVAYQLLYITVQCGLLFVYVQLIGNGWASIAFYLSIAHAIFSFTLPLALVISSAIYVLMIYVVTLHGASLNLALVAGNLPFFVFVVMISRLASQQLALRADREHAMHALAESNSELVEAHRQLQQYASELDELATTRERNRLAREIHDSLGHYLTVIGVQLEVTSKLLERDADKGQIIAQVENSRTLTRECLEEVRRSVAALRPAGLDAGPLSLALSALLQSFEHNTGLDTHFSIEGTEHRLEIDVERAVYRAAQEALTNVQKYAHASCVNVTRSYDAVGVNLSVSDNGIGLVEPPRDGGGFGLANLRATASQLGGSLDLDGPRGCGTTLSLSLPAIPTQVVS